MHVTCACFRNTQNKFKMKWLQECVFATLKSSRTERGYFLGTSIICKVRPSERGSWSTLAMSCVS